MRVVIDWPHKDYFPVTVLQRGELGRVMLMRGFGNNLRVLHLIRREDQLICFSVGDYREESYESMRRLLSTFDLVPDQLSVLCNYPEQTRIAAGVGLAAHFCNTNAFIDEEVFRYQPMQKRFAAVSNARLIRLKRVGLARRVENLALIRGLEFEPVEYDDPADIPHAYINDGPLSPRQVVRVLLASRVGLALSETEGNCMASSEYLLCGLPVVSTPSRGGRDIWYDSENSVICEPDLEAVRVAVRVAHERLDRGQFEPVRFASATSRSRENTDDASLPCSRMLSPKLGRQMTRNRSSTPFCVHLASCRATLHTTCSWVS